MAWDNDEIEREIVLDDNPNPDRGPVVVAWWCSKCEVVSIIEKGWHSIYGHELIPLIHRRYWENDLIALRGELEDVQKVLLKKHRVINIMNGGGALATKKLHALQAVHDKLRVGVAGLAEDIRKFADKLNLAKAKERKIPGEMAYVRSEAYSFAMGPVDGLADKADALLRDGEQGGG